MSQTSSQNQRPFQNHTNHKMIGYTLQDIKNATTSFIINRGASIHLPSVLTRRHRTIPRKPNSIQTHKQTSIERKKRRATKYKDVRKHSSTPGLFPTMVNIDPKTLSSKFESSIMESCRFNHLKLSRLSSLYFHSSSPSIPAHSPSHPFHNLSTLPPPPTLPSTRFLSMPNQSLHNQSW